MLDMTWLLISKYEKFICGLQYLQQLQKDRSSKNVTTNSDR